MKLNNLVAQIVVAPNFDHFSTVEVRSAYLALHNDKTIDPNDARRFVYTELLKLLKRGWIKKSVSKKKGITSFIKTEMFDPAAIAVNPEIYVEKKKDADLMDTPHLGEALTERLNHYKNELLTGFGEAEEYKRLCDQFPNLKSKLQPKYNEVREHNSKLLGCIKAVENLI
ncbi:hypothetical protein [Colwellia sp. Bg11-28]|uniref:hypothetical protein n=1 Tax=Colwellia sp. Bg11-28 TaxID=2058305 RepID=UPI000C321B92|nr:hypothetical protein [Colwellia sp. Bg11-28]PKH85480.1 hypothetical protein CXF79_19660 [Colwellia sp. Bg11-28]